MGNSKCLSHSFKYDVHCCSDTATACSTTRTKDSPGVAIPSFTKAARFARYRAKLTVPTSPLQKLPLLLTPSPTSLQHGGVSVMNVPESGHPRLPTPP